MIAKMIVGMVRFSTAKSVNYEIYNGRYLVQAAPKKPLSSYLLFSIQARKKIPKVQGEKQDVTVASRSIAEQWKTLSETQKQVYEKKASELRAAYESQKFKFEAKFVTPFNKVTGTQLLQKEFHSKNKFPSLSESSKAFAQYKKTINEEQLKGYNEKAQEINKANAAIKKMYEIPLVEYKDFNAYLRATRKQNPGLPEKSKIDKEVLSNLEAAYEAYLKKYELKLKSFAQSFHISMPDLVKMLNKQKSESEKLDEEGRNLKMVQIQQQKLAKEELRKSREQLKKVKQSAKNSAKRMVAKKIKDKEKQVIKKQKAVQKTTYKFTGKINEISRAKKEAQIEKKSEKEMKVKAKVAASPGKQTVQTATKAKRGRKSSTSAENLKLPDEAQTVNAASTTQSAASNQTASNQAASNPTSEPAKQQPPKPAAQQLKLPA